uniref:Uncharacterized protein n=1 Tax=Glossina austeni TaxID=7395 RepID=A0A1A9VXZ4_GLOAU
MQYLSIALQDNWSCNLENISHSKPHHLTLIGIIKPIAHFNYLETDLKEKLMGHFHSSRASGRQDSILTATIFLYLPEITDAKAHNALKRNCSTGNGIYRIIGSEQTPKTYFIL